jgi:coenzyme Q-binding protein COQ10
MPSGTIPGPQVTKKILPYNCEQLFDLVADIERYPEFLSGWVEARIIEQTGNHMRVRQKLGLPFMSHSFISNAKLERPLRLSIHSKDGPFRNLYIEWQFQAVENEHCKVVLNVNVALKSRVLDRLATVFQDTAVRDILACFESRASTLYGADIET